MQGNSFEREIPVTLPESEPRHDVLTTLWARTRVEDLMGQDYDGIQRGAPRADVREAITSLGLEFRLMTQFTSFVAVEEMTITDGGQPRRIDVPVELPEGVSRDAIFGAEVENRAFKKVLALAGMAVAQENFTVAADSSSVSRPRAKRESRSVGSGSGAGFGKGRGGNVSGGARRGGSGPGGSGAANQPVTVADEDAVLRVDRGVKLSPEELKLRELQAKLHPSLRALVERLKTKDAKHGADEAKFVREGRAEVQIWLTEKTEAVLAQLRALGLEVVLDPKSARMVVGRLPLEKLAALAELKAVRYVAPQTRQ